MANVKDVQMQGWIPFDILERGDERVVRMMAEFSAPAWGLTISYPYSEVRYEPNRNGGRTAFYKFQINGREAVSFDGLREDVRSLKAADVMFERAFACDVEVGTPYRDLEK